MPASTWLAERTKGWPGKWATYSCSRRRLEAERWWGAKRKESWGGRGLYAPMALHTPIGGQRRGMLSGSQEKSCPRGVGCCPLLPPTASGGGGAGGGASKSRTGPAAAVGRAQQRFILNAVVVECLPGQHSWRAATATNGWPRWGLQTPPIWWPYAWRGDVQSLMGPGARVPAAAVMGAGPFGGTAPNAPSAAPNTSRVLHS